MNRHLYVGICTLTVLGLAACGGLEDQLDPGGPDIGGANFDTLAVDAGGIGEIRNIAREHQRCGLESVGVFD